MVTDPSRQGFEVSRHNSCHGVGEGLGEAEFTASISVHLPRSGSTC